MNTVLSLINSFSITEYYSEKYKHSDISNNKNEQKDNGLYSDHLYRLKKPHNDIKKQYEIHGDKVLINAHYYTFWIPITEFNKYNFHNK